MTKAIGLRSASFKRIRMIILNVVIILTGEYKKMILFSHKNGVIADRRDQVRYDLLFAIIPVK